MSTDRNEMESKTLLQRSMAGQMETLHKIANGAPLEDILASIINTVELRFQDSTACVVLINNVADQGQGQGQDQGDQKVFYWRHDFSLSELHAAVQACSLSGSKTPWGMAAEEKAQVVAVDFGAWGLVGEELTGHGLAACWSLPIFASTGDVVGVLVLFHRTPVTPTDYELTVLHHYGVVCTISIEKHLLQVENRHLKYHDYLTGLPNKRMFEERLQTMLLQSGLRTQSFSLIVFNIGDFREINVRWGHSVGDQILRSVANRLVDGSRDCTQDAVVCRLGSDEFAVMLPEVTETAAMDAANRLLRSVTRSIEMNGNHFDISVSWGISHYPQDGVDYNSLIRSAVSTMNGGKRNQIHPFAE